MTVMQPQQPAVVDALEVSIARLHGEACWHCGAVNAQLEPIGEVSTVVGGGRRVWTVVACSTHKSRSA